MGIPEASSVEWIAVDWGTTRLRAWAMYKDRPLVEAASNNGMGALEPEGFEPALMDVIGSWLPERTIPVLVCGMAGARQGWLEVPYAQVPARPAVAGARAPHVADPRLSVRILPGLKQLLPPDVMRGEETQIAGYLAQTPEFEGVVCLPGTHTKWAEIAVGEVVEFRTYMTGEIFGLLQGYSVLRHSLASGWDDHAFEESVQEGLQTPEALLERLFPLRASSLLVGMTSAVARSRLSGLLIGAEIAAMRSWLSTRKVVVIGAVEQASAYTIGLKTAGCDPELCDGDGMTLAGLTAAYEEIRKKVVS